MGDGRRRPPRYGAFVFGDRIAVNVTVDWDTLRAKPEIVASALEIVGDDVIPADGGEVDLQVRAGFYYYRIARKLLLHVSGLHPACDLGCVRYVMFRYFLSVSKLFRWI